MVRRDTFMGQRLRHVTVGTHGEIDWPIQFVTYQLLPLDQHDKTHVKHISGAEVQSI